MNKKKYCRVCGQRMIYIRQLVLMPSYDAKTGKQIREGNIFLSCPENEELNPFTIIRHDFQQV